MISEDKINEIYALYHCSASNGLARAIEAEVEETNRALLQKLVEEGCEQADKITELEAKVGELEGARVLNRLSIKRLQVENAALALQNEQQENEIARLTTVPMKYRRMEFNAQLQEENKQQAARIKELEHEKFDWQKEFGEDREDLKKLEKQLSTANALIEQARDAMATFKEQHPHMVKGYWYDALAAIESQ